MEFVIPDFVVVGATYPNGQVMLLASKTLTEAELRTLVDYPDMPGPRLPYVPPRVDIKLITQMDDYIQVWGDSYSEAWQTLFSRWSPRDDREYMTIEEFNEQIKELPR